MRASRPLVALLLAFSPLAAQTVVLQPTGTAEVTETRTVPLAPGSTLRVSNLNGSIQVEAWDRPEVQFTGAFKPSSEGEQAKVVIEPGAHGLEIRGEFPKHAGRGTYRGPECRMTLKVPRQVRPGLQTVNGEILLRGTRGGADLSTVNGAIRAWDLPEPLKARTVNGAIHLVQVAGALDAGTVNGAIEATGLDGKEGGIKAETVNGAIRLQLAGVKGRLEATTVNGRISFTTPGAEQVDVRKRRVRAHLPGGDQALDIRTVNGGITLE